MEEKDFGLPKELLKQVEEHTSSFALFYYDFKGNPILYTFYPETKDKMAMVSFIAEYLTNQPPLFGDNKRIDEEED